jgi:hypothetical protein
MEITESNLLDLLIECVPFLMFVRGGISGVEETLGRVKFVLELAGRVIKEDTNG